MFTPCVQCWLFIWILSKASNTDAMIRQYLQMHLPKGTMTRQRPLHLEYFGVTCITFAVALYSGKFPVLSFRELIHARGHELIISGASNRQNHTKGLPEMILLFEEKSTTVVSGPGPSEKSVFAFLSSLEA